MSYFIFTAIYTVTLAAGICIGHGSAERANAKYSVAKSVHPFGCQATTLAGRDSRRYSARAACSAGEGIETENRMSTTIIVSTELSTVTCPHCGGIYAITQTYLNEAKRLGAFKQCWTCPYCKVERGYGMDTIERLRKELADSECAKKRLEVNVKWWSDKTVEVEKERDHFRKSRDGMKGALIKTKQRVGTGTCPCCNCVFPNLQFHMATQHPAYKNENAETL